MNIQAPNPPFDFGPDDTGFPRYSFNIIAMKRYSQTFLEELLRLLVEKNVGQENVNLFATSTAVLPNPTPDTDTPILNIRDTGGPGSKPTHNEFAPPAIVQPSAQIIVRSLNIRTARTMAFAAYDALNGVKNRDV
jgi:hypothetical protein